MPRVCTEFLGRFIYLFLIIAVHTIFLELLVVLTYSPLVWAKALNVFFYRGAPSHEAVICLLQCKPGNDSCVQAVDLL